MGATRFTFDHGYVVNRMPRRTLLAEPNWRYIRSFRLEFYTHRVQLRMPPGFVQKRNHLIWCQIVKATAPSHLSPRIR
jgi:hypothetical protein